MLSDAGDDGATAQPVIDTELKELVCLGYLRAFGDCPHTDVELEEVVKGNVFGDRSSVVFGCCVGFLGRLELLDLCFDDFVLDLLEEEAGFTEGMSCFDEVTTTEITPLRECDGEHLTELLAAHRQEGGEGDGKVRRDL